MKAPDFANDADLTKARMSTCVHSIWRMKLSRKGMVGSLCDAESE